MRRRMLTEVGHMPRGDKAGGMGGKRSGGAKPKKTSKKKKAVKKR